MTDAGEEDGGGFRWFEVAVVTVSACEAGGPRVVSVVTAVALALAALRLLFSRLSFDARLGSFIVRGPGPFFQSSTACTLGVGGHVVNCVAGAGRSVRSVKELLGEIGPEIGVRTY